MSFPNIHAGKSRLAPAHTSLTSGKLNSLDQELGHPASCLCRAGNKLREEHRLVKLCKTPEQGLEDVTYFPKESAKCPQRRQKMQFPAATAKSFFLSSSWKSERAVAALVNLLGFSDAGEDVVPETVRASLSLSLV